MGSKADPPYMSPMCLPGAPLPCLSSGRAETAQHRPENFLDTLSNSGPAVRLYGEGRATGPPEYR